MSSEILVELATKLPSSNSFAKPSGSEGSLGKGHGGLSVACSWLGDSAIVTSRVVGT